MSPRAAGLGLAGAAAIATGALVAAVTTPAAAVTTPSCATAGLVIWMDTHPGAAAGSAYYKLHFTNLSGRACTLRGYPGVSGVDLRGRRLGRAAGRDPAQPIRRVRLRSGGTATTVVRIVDVRNFPGPACRRVVAAGLRVYPPNQMQSKVVPVPFGACSRAGPAYLSVRAVRS